MVEPKITVILPVYNGGKYLLQAVESVLAQSMEDFELLVLDDCSTDGSRAYLQSLRDDRLKVFLNKSNRGLFWNLNFLSQKARSPLIKLWAQDDVMYPNCLADFVDFHHKHPGVGFSFCATDYLDGDAYRELPMKYKEVDILNFEEHAITCYHTGSIAGNIANVCILKRALDEVGPFNESMKISADFEMWVRLSKYYKVGYTAKKSILLRNHHQQLSNKKSLFYLHIKEDLETFRLLDDYADENLRKRGKEILKNTKYRFYTTLLLNTLKVGDFVQFKKMYGLMKDDINIPAQIYSLVKSKLWKGK